MGVSIHAPAGGATRAHPGKWHHGSCFNPRARGGRDAYELDTVVSGAMFQSTRPRGARHRNMLNSRTSREFQSTRPRGARPMRYGRIDTEARFQSTRPRGARQSFLITFQALSKFQSTRPRGARPLYYELDNLVLMFQSTRPRGARLCTFQIITIKTNTKATARSCLDRIPKSMDSPSLCFQRSI